MLKKPDIPKLPGVEHEVHFTRSRKTFFIIPADTAIEPGVDELWCARRGWFHADASRLSGYKVSPIRGVFWMLRNLCVTAPRILWMVMTNTRSTETQAQIVPPDDQIPSIAEEKTASKEQDLSLAFDRAAASVSDPELRDTIEKLRKRVVEARRDGEHAATDEPS